MGTRRGTSGAVSRPLDALTGRRARSRLAVAVTAAVLVTAVLVTACSSRARSPVQRGSVVLGRHWFDQVRPGRAC